MKDSEKAQFGAKTFQNFCEQFGNDVYSRELLTVLFEVLLILGPNEIDAEGEIGEGDST